MHTAGGLAATSSKEQHNFNKLQIYLCIKDVMIGSKEIRKPLTPLLLCYSAASTF